jgi:cation diffusion facilitator CzcD-associated flavoprotein CzcO
LFVSRHSGGALPKDQRRIGAVTLESRSDVLIVGAGPAGLAVGGCLARRGVRARLLERGAAPGWSWVQHYEPLRLHTSRGLSALPGLALRSATPYPGRAEVEAYLAAYARRFDLAVATECAVTAVAAQREGADGWRVETSRGPLRARHVVLATGFFSGPRTPDWPGRDLFQGRWLRPGDLGGDDLAGRRVLVVGLGNTGADMLVELRRRGANVAVAVRGAVQVAPLEILGVNCFRWAEWLPDRAPTVGRLLGARAGALAERLAARLWCRFQERRFGDLRERGLALKSMAEIHRAQRAGLPPVVGGPWVDLVRRGEVTVLPAVAAVTPEGVVLADGRRERFDALLLATGLEESRFRLAGELPERLRDGAVAGRPGLWLCGAAPALRHIRRSASRLAGAIARELAARPRASPTDSPSTEAPNPRAQTGKQST